MSKLNGWNSAARFLASYPWDKVRPCDRVKTNQMNARSTLGQANRRTRDKNERHTQQRKMVGRENTGGRRPRCKAARPSPTQRTGSLPGTAGRETSTVSLPPAQNSLNHVETIPSPSRSFQPPLANPLNYVVCTERRQRTMKLSNRN